MFITVIGANSQPHIHRSSLFVLFDFTVRTYTTPSEVVRSRWAKLNDLVEVHLVIRYFSHASFPKSHLLDLKRVVTHKARLPIWSKPFLHSLPNRNSSPSVQASKQWKLLCKSIKNSRHFQTRRVRSILGQSNCRATIVVHCHRGQCPNRIADAPVLACPIVVASPIMHDLVQLLLFQQQFSLNVCSVIVTVLELK